MVTPTLLKTFATVYVDILVAHFLVTKLPGFLHWASRQQSEQLIISCQNQLIGGLCYLSQGSQKKQTVQMSL